MADPPPAGPPAGAKRPEVCVAKMVRLMTQGKPVHAFKLGLQGLAHDPEDRRLLSTTAAALAHQGPRKKIPILLREAPVLVGDDWDLLSNLLFLYNDGDHFHLSGVALQTFFDAGGVLPSTNPWPWVHAANGYAGLERYDEAAALARRGVAVHGHPVGYHSLASVYGRAKDRAGVIEAVGLAKAHDYEAFATIRNDVELAFLAGDPVFEAVFASVVDRNAFRANFGGYPPPPELVALLAFQDSVGEEPYAGAFRLLAVDASAHRPWSDNPGLRMRLLPFATADDAGALYALWAQPDRDSLGSAPVVVCAREGSARIVAGTIKELLCIVAFEGDDDDADDDGDAHAQYVRWLGTEMRQHPATHPAKLAAAAAKKWQESLAQWLAR